MITTIALFPKLVVSCTIQCVPLFFSQEQNCHMFFLVVLAKHWSSRSSHALCELIQDGRLLGSHWLRDFESSFVIGPQNPALWVAVRIQLCDWLSESSYVIGSQNLEKMSKKKGGKMKFSPVPPLTLRKLIFFIFSARKIIKQVEIIFLFSLSPSFLL